MGKSVQDTNTADCHNSSRQKHEEHMSLGIEAHSVTRAFQGGAKKCIEVDGFTIHVA